MSNRRGNASGLPVIHDRAAGIDVGSRFHVVTVDADLCSEPVQTFQAFTSDLKLWTRKRATQATSERAGLNEVSTLYRDRDPEFLETLQLVRTLTKELEGQDFERTA